MPIDKYLLIRKAAEIEEISERLQLISDIGAAFSGNKEHFDKLKKLYDNLSGSGLIIIKKPDSNWEERMGRFKR